MRVDLVGGSALCVSCCWAPTNLLTEGISSLVGLELNSIVMKRHLWPDEHCDGHKNYGVLCFAEASQAEGIS